MMMKKIKNISLIRLMMIISQVLLFIFVGNWLYNQYHEQKITLTKDLQRGLRESEQQVMDSIIAKNVIDPILGDVRCYTIKLDSDLPTTNSIGKVNTIIKQVHVGNSKTNLNTQLFDTIQTIADTSKMLVHTLFKNDTDNEILFHGIRMFINKIGYNNSNEACSNSFINMTLASDTTSVKKSFKNFLNKNNYNFSIDWLSRQEKTIKKKYGIIYLYCNFFNNSIRSEISHYQLFLLKKISPQILFALLLLLLTSAAFRLSYISMKNQKRLITIKNDFISNISHELKTPVSTVKVALEALLDFDMKKNSKVINEYLEMSLSEMNRLDLLVTKVLNTSALEDGKQFVIPEKTNFNQLINEVLYSLQLRFNQLQAEVKFEAEENECMAMIDKLHIQGVLINLIDNSLKYCNDKPRINIYLSENEKEIKLTISDNGIGIPEEYLDKVFDKFFRVPTGDKHNIKGYGLGLNYAALVMKHHHGKIEVKNLKEGGCAFTLIFPKLLQ